jgi:hypothetical protein
MRLPPALPVIASLFRTIALTVMPGIGPAEERPFFDRLYPAMT